MTTVLRRFRQKIQRRRDKRAVKEIEQLVAVLKSMPRKVSVICNLPHQAASMLCEDLAPVQRMAGWQCECKCHANRDKEQG